MSAVAVDLPEEISAARDGLLAFAGQEITPRHLAYYVTWEALYGRNCKALDTRFDACDTMR